MGYWQFPHPLINNFAPADRIAIVLDFNENHQVVGIEILKVKDRVPLANLKQMQFEVA